MNNTIKVCVNKKFYNVDLQENKIFDNEKREVRILDEEKNNRIISSANRQKKEIDKIVNRGYNEFGNIASEIVVEKADILTTKLGIYIIAKNESLNCIAWMVNESFQKVDFNNTDDSELKKKWENGILIKRILSKLEE